MYKIYASSKYGTEQIDTAKSLKEAYFLIWEYRMAYGHGFSIYAKKNGKEVN